jgi:hypothetical protein
VPALVVAAAGKLWLAIGTSDGSSVAPSAAPAASVRVMNVANRSTSGCARVPTTTKPSSSLSPATPGIQSATIAGKSPSSCASTASSPAGVPSSAKARVKMSRLSVTGPLSAAQVTSTRSPAVASGAEVSLLPARDVTRPCDSVAPSQPTRTIATSRLLVSPSTTS